MKAFLIVVVAMMFSQQAFAAALPATGRIKVCKEGKPEDWPEPNFWRREVIVPVGAVFKDAGEKHSKDPLAGLIRLRIVAAQEAHIAGKQKCKVIDAYIPEDYGDWGTLYAAPVRTTIKKSDNRVLEVERWGDSSEPAGKLAPWAEVVPIEATIENDFKN